jgi:hypothetical protein
MKFPFNRPIIILCLYEPSTQLIGIGFLGNKCRSILNVLPHCVIKQY